MEGRQRGSQTPVTPGSFQPARHLTLSAVRRIYRTPQDAAERRRRFRDEMWRRCGVKVWTWEELVRPDACCLADSCRVPTPSSQEALHFRYRDYSPRKMRKTIAMARDSVKENEKNIEQKFLDLEKEMANDARGVDSRPANLLLSESTASALNFRRRGSVASSATHTDVAWNRRNAERCSSTFTKSQYEEGKAFERRALLYFDWDSSVCSSDREETKRKETHSIADTSYRKNLLYPQLTVVRNRPIVVDRKVEILANAYKSKEGDNPGKTEQTSRKTTAKESHHSERSVQNRRRAQSPVRKAAEQRCVSGQFLETRSRKHDLKGVFPHPASARGDWKSALCSSQLDSSRGSVTTAASVAVTSRFRSSRTASSCKAARLPPLQEQLGDEGEYTRAPRETSPPARRKRAGELARCDALSRFARIPAIKKGQRAGDADCSEYWPRGAARGTSCERGESSAQEKFDLKPLPPLKDKRFSLADILCAGDDSKTGRKQIVLQRKSSKKPPFYF